MMRAVVRSFYSPDIEDLSSPELDGGDFSFLLCLMVGPADGPGEELFELVVCTASSIARLVRIEGPLLARHLMIVEGYDVDVIIGFLKRRIETLEAESWGALAGKIARIAKWEFEDYLG